MKLHAVNRMLAVLYGVHLDWIVLRDGDDLEASPACVSRSTISEW